MTNISRRSVLGTTAALSLGVPRARAAQPVSPLMATLSTYMAEAAGKKLPDNVAEQAKLHILDTLGAMISGSTLRPGKLSIAFARAYGGEKVASVAASNLLIGPIEAAFCNAILSHSDETDDSHAPSMSHPGASIVPATMAAGEKFGIDGTRFLRAVALGYDIGPRVTMAFDPDVFQTKRHRSTHAVSGLFGSSAAAGCCAGLDQQGMRWLLDYTAQQSAGTASWQRDRDHIEKAFVFAGMAARGGVTGALLVQAGWTAVDDVLSGEDNFFDAYGSDADTAKLIDGLGQRFEITRTNIKKWTVGSPIQAPLDGLYAIVHDNKLHADDVASVTVRVATREAAVVNNRDIPDICLQHMAAVMLLDGTASFSAAHDVPRMKDPAVLKQRAKINLVPDDVLEKRLPVREAIVEVVTTDGRKFTQDITAVRGTAQNPMTRQEVVDKVRDLINPVLGKPKSDQLIRRVLELEKEPSIRALRSVWQLG